MTPSPAPIRRPFTPAEDAVIVARYGQVTLRQIAAELDRRTWRTVQDRVAVLLARGVVPARRSLKPPPWTPQDDDRLRELWGLVPDEVAARTLGRSVEACKIRATRHLGQARSDQFLTARALGRLFGVESKAVVRWMARGWLRGRRSAVPAGPSAGMWRFDAEDVERFIRRYPYAYDRTRIERGTYERNLADQVVARDPYLTVPEAAAALGVDAETVRHHLRRGWLPGVRAPRTGNNGLWLVRRSDLGRFHPRRPPVPGSTGNSQWGAGAWSARTRKQAGMEAAG